MEYKIGIKDSTITLTHDDLDSSINIDDLTRIDTSNIFGEHVTISAAVARIGLLKAEVQARMSTTKMAYKLYENDFKSKLRKQASKNAGKFKLRVDDEDVEVRLTEKALETCFESDKQWQKLKLQFITAEKNFNALDVLYWACQDKSRKLNGLVGGTTPEDYIAGIVEGKVNGLLIKKSEDKTSGIGNKQ
jgi:predicted HicB family RNase H-like nuclease